jgi:hypothetical protein
LKINQEKSDNYLTKSGGGLETCADGSRFG